MRSVIVRRHFSRGCDISTDRQRKKALQAYKERKGSHKLCIYGHHERTYHALRGKYI